jgi:hypothetical protein
LSGRRSEVWSTLEGTKEVTVMLFGAHAFIWTGEWTPEGAEKAIGGGLRRPG